MNLFRLLLLMTVLYSCGSGTDKMINANKFLGGWINIDPNASEPSMVFTNGNAQINCKVDTVLFYLYKTSGDTLILKNNGNEVRKSLILLLNKDSLVLKDLGSSKETAHFYLNKGQQDFHSK